MNNQQQRLIELFNAAYEYCCYDISDNDIELILSNGGYFATELGYADIPITQENYDVLSLYLSEKDKVFNKNGIHNKNMIFSGEVKFTTIEEAKAFNQLLSSLCDEELYFKLVIKGVDDDGKEHYSAINEWLF